MDKLNIWPSKISYWKWSKITVKDFIVVVCNKLGVYGLACVYSERANKYSLNKNRFTYLHQ